MGLFDLFRRRESAQPDVSAADLAEAEQEMREGLEALAAFERSDLPVLHTQHRVIGSDACHYMAPASVIAEVDAGGKVFVTSAKIIFASGSVVSWPWHLITRIRREERDLVIDLKGRPAVRLRVNTYGDALLIEALVVRLTSNRP
ncbi:MAG: hypothetical protein IT185_02995 [Acidobacteria bacterium]|nr:hypothetical protein [Acidobacteriota bacterium]